MSRTCVDPPAFLMTCASPSPIPSWLAGLCVREKLSVITLGDHDFAYSTRASMQVITGTDAVLMAHSTRFRCVYGNFGPPLDVDSVT